MTTDERLHPVGARLRPTLNMPHPITLAIYAITFVLAALAIHLLVSQLVAWGTTKLDDLHYGRPRTTHLSGVVGHGDSDRNPTHFIALNLQQQVVVLELPGGDATQVRSLPGPYIFGDNQELTPVLLSLRDIDQDTYADLLITVHNEQVVYLNREGSFRLPTAEEQAALLQEQGP
jgi:hypothetical protein